MRTQNSQLRNKIQQQGEVAHGQGRSYDDRNEREALRNFLCRNKDFQKLWEEYFGCPENSYLLEDPLGKKNVDMGFVSSNEVHVRPHKSQTIHGLIEVDVFNSWGETYPPNYKKFHVLERKLRYFQETDYKYLTCTFNCDHNQMVCTTKDNIERCLDIYGITNMWMPKIKAYDMVLRCPLDENIFWFGVNRGRK